MERAWIGKSLFTLACAHLLILGPFTTPTIANSQLNPVPIGSWGGEHIQLDVTAEGAKVEFDCAAGTIDEPLLFDPNGNFEVHGTHAIARGGPGQPGMPSLMPERPALYRGWTDGNRMHLTVILVESGREVGTFSLVLGQRAYLERCM